MLKHDVIRLRHMREAAAYAQEMAAGRTRSDLDENIMLRMALTHCLEILGEAASKVASETRAQLPSIPFVQMVAMRHRLIHAYFDVDLDIVWTEAASRCHGSFVGCCARDFVRPTSVPAGIGELMAQEARLSAPVQ